MSFTFEAVFEALHGVRPYAWQCRLSAEVIENGWPRIIAAPTGSGKTAVLDIALYHLASEDRAVSRRAPRRVVFAVDRRVVVDQAFERASCIKQRLSNPGSRSPLVEMQKRLLAIASGDGADAPLHVEELRGGLPREDDWALTPTQPTILCTTVDQLGSRLLFRGYGVSPAMAPIHAGLLGNDTLIVLDEAHLSAAFAETLARVEELRNSAEQPLGLPFAVTMLTATPSDGASAFQLTEAERAEEAIRKRLEARKRTRLIAAKRGGPAGADDQEERPADAEDEAEENGRRFLPRDAAPFIEAAKKMCEEIGCASTIAVVVNRVDLARAIFEALRAGEPSPHEAILLTGRVRPIERDDLIGQYRGRLEGRAKADKPLFVVATQCIEAGADFDFDGLVTQIAPLDALAQRLGRLARSGERDGKPAPAAIIALPQALSRKVDDPVYGDRMRITWEWLKQKAEEGAEGASSRQSKAKRGKSEPTLDLGPNQLAALIADDPGGAKACCTPAMGAPYLRAADLEFWSMTNPAPYPDPCLPLYLHGDPRIDSDVSIVWRADLSETDLAHEERAIEIVAAMPPRPGEALRLPIRAARRFLAEAPDNDGADAPERLDNDNELPVQGRRKAVRWRGKDPKVIEANAIGPGDTLVVPASYGGCDRYGWAPASKEPVADIAQRSAGAFQDKQRVLRLHPALFKNAGGNGEAEGESLWVLIEGYIREAPRSSRSVQSWLKRLLHDLEKSQAGGNGENGGDAELRRHLVEQLRKFEARKARLIWPYRTNEADMPEGVVIVAGGEAVETDDDDVSSFTDRPQMLEGHVADVERMAARFAKTLALPERITGAILLAARHHDDGKRDERFQAYLRSVAENGMQPIGGDLAKSGARASRVEDLRLRERAGLPSPWRHEALSVRLFAQRAASLGQPREVLDLALWLIGTHHGQGRPFFRHADPWDGAERPIGAERLPPGQGPERLDFDWHGDAWADLFEQMKRCYGIWGTAYLEAVLRLADHRASERPKERADGAKVR
jgi:CRISPR-associated endonuclease/helicase Cas3